MRMARTAAYIITHNYAHKFKHTYVFTNEVIGDQFDFSKLIVTCV